MSRGRSSPRVVVKESTNARAIELSRVRLMCVALFFALCFVSINVRLIELMISAPHTLPRMFPQRILSELTEPEDLEVSVKQERLKRGDFVDRNGVLVATSLMTASAYANPREISGPENVALKLEKAIGVPHDVLLKRLKSDKTFVWIKRHLTPAEQQAVNTLGIPGIYFQPEEERFYPFGSLLAHVVGYVGIDNKGLAGMEGYFERRLTDDVLGRQPVQLSLDVRLQHILREELRASMDEFRAIGATGVIMDLKTSEILAMTSLPDFDPHRPSKAKDDQKFNRAALGLYEMGSTFKTFTTALALDSGVTSMKGSYDATNPLKYASFTISDTHPKRRWLSVPEIYAYSSNIGTARMALATGTAKQKAFMEKLGMLKAVELELPERASPLYPKDWKEINTLTISYGHGISVTPLHLVRGIAGVVQGKLPPLTLVKGGNKGKAEGTQVVGEKTAANIADLMRLVVRHGTGTKADIMGYRVGGKTGTAEKVGSGGGYNKDNKMALFVSTFPVDDPAYVILVMVDEPRGNKSTFGYATGGWIAAPVAGRVIARMAPLLGLKPDFAAKGDDAERWWPETEKKPSFAKVAPQPAVMYVRPATY